MQTIIYKITQTKCKYIWKIQIFKIIKQRSAEEYTMKEY